MRRFTREDMIELLGRVHEIAKNDENARAVYAAICTWQDDVQEYMRKSGVELEIGVVVEPDDCDLPAELITGIESPQEFFRRLESQTLHMRELLPRDWAGLYIVSSMCRFSHDATVVETAEALEQREKGLELLHGPDSDRLRNKLTEVFKQLMAARGDFTQAPIDG
ncbi:hypothetical protein ACFV24_32905 [Nocardia fluminea]|uniref:hypothetical protein n=1 Tax=Nocardia fluminea TaxID=134984 RepID=UPI00366DE1C1